MMQYEIIRSVLMIPFLFIFVTALTEYRYSAQKAVYSMLILGGFSLLINLLISVNLGAQLCYMLSPVTVTIPMMVHAIIIAKHRDTRLLFSILTACSLSIVSGMVGSFGRFLVHHPALGILLTLIAYILMVLIVFKFFRKPFFEMMHMLKYGWLILSFIPFGFYSIFYYFGFAPSNMMRKSQSFPMLLALVGTLVVSYLLIHTLYKQLRRQYGEDENRRCLQFQVEMLKRQNRVSEKSEEETRIYYHDIRHYLKIIAAHLHSGDEQKALEVINKIEQIGEERPLQHYCKNLMVNATLSSYLDTAIQQGIAVTQRLDIPQQLPVDDLELSVVIANALDNAINACADIPASRPRFIHLLASRIGEQMIIEIVNSYTGTVIFDPQSGLPVTEKVDHGIGAHSIAAFARKYDAMLDFAADNQVFQLRILINLA